MAWARNGGTSVNGASLAFPAAITTGDLLLCAVRIGNTSHSVTPPTDTITTTYAQVTGSPQTSGTDHKLYLWYGVAPSGASAGANTVTPQGSGFGTERIIVAQYSGNATSNVLDTGTSANGSSAAPDSGTITAAANDLLYCIESNVDGLTGTQGTNWTKYSEQDAKIADEDQGLTAGVSAGNYNGTWAITSDPWCCIVAGFKIASAGGAASQQVASLPMAGVQ